jgi:hypothetical protein
LTAELEATRKKNSNLWSAMQHVANLIRVPEDTGKSWVQFFQVMLERFNKYVHMAAKASVRLVLAQIRVLWPIIPLEKLTEEIEDEVVV